MKYEKAINKISEKEFIVLQKKPDGSYEVIHSSGNSSISGGLDGAIKVACAVFKYPINYLIEDLTDET